MDKKLTIDNKKYLSSTHAGKISGYTNDYVARLARQKKVAGKKVGRTWYVEESSLKSFIQNNKIQKTNLHKKLSDKRTNDLKFFERDRKLSEEFQAFKSNVSLASKTELFKKSTAFALAIIFVFGGYFVSNTDIAQAGFRKVSQAVVGALDAVSKFNPAEFGISSVLTFKDAGKDAALNVHRGMEKSKLLSAEASKKTYLIAKGDSATWQDLKDGAIYKVNSSITSAIFNIKNNATKSVAGVSNIISPYSNFQNTRANVFASIAGSINSIIKDEALYVNKTVNSVICKFSTCGGEVEETVLVQVQKEIPKESIVKENIPEKVVVIDPSPKVVTNQPVIERVIETREIIVSGGITREDLELAIQQFSNKVYSDMSSLTSANETRIINNYSVIAQTNKIDKLGSVTISNSTISGTLSGLTDAHIPDSITASNYLPLTGGTLTGGLTAEYFTATSSTATSTFRGQISSTFVPTVAHSFGAWAVDVAGAEATNASFYINPASAAADTNLFSISVNDGAKFIIDAEGDLFANSITAVGGVTLSTTTASTFTVENDLTIGDATTTDSIYLNAMLASSLIPKYDNAFDIGSSSPQRMWRTGYFGTSIGIGTSSPYATLSIEGSSALGNSALAGYFTATSTTATSTIAGGLDIDNGGFVYDFTTNNVGIGTASPTQALDVVGTGTFSTSIIASTATLTGGSLTDSSGAISFGDENLTTTGTLSISGLTSLIQASTTRLSVFDTAYFGGTATSTFNSAGVLTMAGNIIMSDNSITGIDTLTFTDTSGTIAGIQNQNLVDKTATETILGLWNFTNTGTTTIANLWTENLQVGTVLEAPYFTATSTSQASTFPYASSTALTVSGSTYLGSLTGSLQAVNGLVSATSSLSSSFIEDVYLRNDANDTTTGTLTASSYLSSGSGTSTLANLWANIFQVGSLIETPYFNATSTTASSTIAHGLNVLAINQTGTATSTFAQGIDLANGCFSVNGTCVGGGSGGVGSGTQGQLAFYDSAGTNLTATSTLFLTQTGNFGLGTTSPYAKLSVEMGVGDTGVMFAIASSTNGTATTTHFIVSESGNVGIGTSSPYAALSVEGSSVLGNSALAGYFTATSTTATSTFMGIFSIGSTTPAATALFSVGTSSPLLYIDKITGNVGVGSSGGSDRQLEVLATGDAQLRLSQDSTTYTDFVVAPTTGDLTINMYPNSSADDIILAMPGGSTGANLWICEGTACPVTTFSGGGNLFVEGDIKYATSSRKTYRSIILTSAGSVVPTSSGAAKTQVDGTNHSYYVLDFDAAADEAAYWQWTMPDSYDGGTIDITYYWEAASTSSDVIWCFQTAGIQGNNSEDIDPSLSSAVCETDTAQGNANDLASVEETDATSGFVAGDYVSFKVFRDADNGSDTMSGDARLVKVKIEYGVDQESD